MTADTRSRLARCAALIALVAAGHAQASLLCDGECPPPSGPPAPPSLPTLPAAVSVSGNFFAYPNSNVVEGQLNDNGWFTFGGGAYKPYHNEVLSFGDSGSGASLQVSLQPMAAVTSTATQSNNYGRSQSGAGLGYRVVLTASDQLAADHISSLLGSSGAIASIHGAYALTGSGYGYGSVRVQTGGVAGQNNPGLAPVSYVACGSYGTVLGGNCAGTFSQALNFVAGSSFAGGDPLSFISAVSLSTDAQAGVAGAFSTGYAGTMTAYLDPTVTLAPGIQGSLVLGAGNNVSNLSPVPEPAQALLLVAGLLALGGTVGRRRRT